MTRGLAERLAFGPPLLFDGALATELERRGFDTRGGLWSARALRDAPELLLAIHEDYLRRGADLVSTASYQASITGFAAAGIDEREAGDLMRGSVAIARRAIASAGGGRPRLVAASLGPYGATLGGGREYDGDYGDTTPEELRAFHRRRIEAVLPAAPDFFLFETLPRLDEALEIADLLEDLELPAILSFQLRSATQTGSGDLLRIAVEELNGYARVPALGINCCAPSIATAGLETALDRSLKPVVVQANSGETWDGEGWRPAARDEDIVLEARRWLELGARGIGACCRSGPETIAAMRALIDG